MHPQFFYILYTFLGKLNVYFQDIDFNISNSRCEVVGDGVCHHIEYL